jgi:hypothetical protein
MHLWLLSFFFFFSSFFAPHTVTHPLPLARPALSSFLVLCSPAACPFDCALLTLGLCTFSTTTPSNSHLLYVFFFVPSFRVHLVLSDGHIIKARDQFALSFVFLVVFYLASQTTTQPLSDLPDVFKSLAS